MSGTPSPRPDQPCAVNGVSRLLDEEPRLEAVALRGSDGTLSVATIGSLDRDRITQRVSDAVPSRLSSAENPTSRASARFVG